MSDYNLQIAWSGKDALSDSDPDKIVSGGDFNTEFLAVKTAVNSKADLANTSQVVTAATATAGTNTNQVATTAFVTAAFQAMYPVGSIYTNAEVSTNPATLLGFGTWEAYAEGRVPVGKASSGTFNTLNATGGAETHTLSVAEMPAHTHSYDKQVTSTDAISIHDIVRTTGGNTGATTGSTGSGNAHNNLQPYIVVYMWKRTA
jgi:microcystin-dependent protein